jgi:hypothetical protein
MTMNRPTFLLFSLLAVPAALLVAQPVLHVVDGTKLNLGTIYRGQVIEKTVTLKNTGTDTLILGRVDVSCGCTAAMASSDRIPKGGTGTLKITFNSRNFAGEIHKSVTVNSNSADSPATVIEFTGTVVNEIELSPMQLFLKETETGRTTTVTFKIRNNGKEPLQLKSFRTPLEGFSVTLPEAALKPGLEVELTAQFTPKKAIQLISDGVFISTSNPNQPEVYLPIFGSVKESKFQ